MLMSSVSIAVSLQMRLIFARSKWASQILFLNLYFLFVIFNSGLKRLVGIG